MLRVSDLAKLEAADIKALTARVIQAERLEQIFEG